MHRTKLWSALVVTALCAGLATPNSALADTALGSSKWSLEIGTILGSFSNEYSFAVRRHSGPSSAYRLSVSAYNRDRDGTGLNTTTGSPDQVVTQTEVNSNYRIALQWMRFAQVNDNVTATFALGPVLDTSRSGSRYEAAAGLPSFNGSEYSNSEVTYGAELGLGVEWFFNPRFSLGAQSGIRAMTGTGKNESISRSGTGATYSKTEVAVDSDITEFTSTSARIQLTGYF